MGEDAQDHIGAGKSLDELIFVDSGSVDGAALLDDIAAFLSLNPWMTR